MEQLLAAFGIDVRLITIQVINFVVLAAVLSYFLYKPVLKILNEREAKIKQSIKDAEAAAEFRNNAEKEKKSILTAAESEAEAVSERAKEHAQKQAQEVLADADKKVALTLKNAETQSQSLKDKAIKDSEAEIAKLAVLGAEKVLRERSS